MTLRPWNRTVADEREASGLFSLIELLIALLSDQSSWSAPVIDLLVVVYVIALLIRSHGWGAPS
ncbi:MAG: hypothetical protein IPM18_09080 [Phycisphaerales bacterium]|nr:hypothetical protein [Phycisphaerales bacterium]